MSNQNTNRCSPTRFIIPTAKNTNKKMIKIPFCWYYDHWYFERWYFDTDPRDTNTDTYSQTHKHRHTFTDAEPEEKDEKQEMLVRCQQRAE